MKAPDILHVASRQYQHNDCSGLTKGFDYKETISIVEKLEIDIEILKAGINSANNYLECEDDSLSLDAQDEVLKEFYIAKAIFKTDL